MLGLGFLVFAGQYVAFTYIAPFLERVTGISGGLISVFLFAYGLATAVGVFAGGRFADHDASRTLIVGNTVLIMALGALYLVGTNPILVVALLVVWGVFGLGLVPSLQYRVVSLAGPGRDLAAALPASAFNAGIAAGALAGGRVIANHSLPSVFLVALAICAVALLVAWVTRLLRYPATPEPAGAVELAR
jgi:DHA1 family inner membrane transport protein